MKIPEGRFVHLVSFLAAVMTLWWGLERYWIPASPDAKVGFLVLGMFAFLFLLFAMVQEYRFSRKARYAEALGQIHQIYTLCSRWKETKDLDRDFQEVCDALARAYDLITGTRCAACLKIINQKVEESEVENPCPTVKTISRDRHSMNRQDTSDKVTDWIDKNTDFKRIFYHHGDPDGKVFFQNDLPRLPDYDNTSFERWGRQKFFTVPGVSLKIPLNRWPLPYKSAVVCPILPNAFSDAEPDILGFLCLDSRSRGVFRRRYDEEMVVSIAASLYPSVKRWHTEKTQGEQERGA